MGRGGVLTSKKTDNRSTTEPTELVFNLLRIRVGTLGVTAQLIKALGRNAPLVTFVPKLRGVLFRSSTLRGHADWDTKGGCDELSAAPHHKLLTCSAARAAPSTKDAARVIRVSLSQAKSSDPVEWVHRRVPNFRRISKFKGSLPQTNGSQVTRSSHAVLLCNY
ncbi:hypothetical protein B5807_07568 [Epicoccum nigrum]|uniref:Uncharacterized protein n=1 Tax=Epicoccum nigrum TaxID=105696 RepID=A0A1Y2LUS0_EPING|nr:hypothetical protein B5807_07568 [Epicoccum nigrum]